MLRAILLSAAISALSISSAMAMKTYRVGATLTTNNISIVRGQIVLNDSGIRSFGQDLYHLRSSTENFEKRTWYDANSTSSEGAAVGASMAANDSASEQSAEHTSDPVNANALSEVSYDLSSGKRVEIDHQRKTLRSSAIVNATNASGQSVLAGMPEGADPKQMQALQGLFNTMSAPRLEPKQKIKIVASGENGIVVINGQAVACDWFTMDRMGGRFGRACLAEPANVPHGDELLAIISQLPLAGAGGNDPVGRLRQLSESGKLPVQIFDDGFDLPVTIETIDVEDVADVPVDSELDESLEIVERKIRDQLAGYEYSEQ